MIDLPIFPILKANLAVTDLLESNGILRAYSFGLAPENPQPPTGLSLLKQNASIIFDIKREFDEEIKKHKANMSYIQKNQNSQSKQIKKKSKIQDK